MRGFVLGEPDVGYELLAKDYGRFDSPVSARRDLRSSGQAGPVALLRLMRPRVCREVLGIEARGH